jgi:hypothetical protein
VIRKKVVFLAQTHATHSNLVLENTIEDFTERRAPNTPLYSSVRYWSRWFNAALRAAICAIDAPPGCHFVQ